MPQTRLGIAASVGDTDTVHWNHGVEQNSIGGGKLLSLWPSKKSGEKLLAPAPKFKEQGFAPLQEGRGAQVWHG